METSGGPANRHVTQQGLARLIGRALYQAATSNRTWLLAIYELSLEATRRGLITLFGGALFVLATSPPESVTAEGTNVLARCIVTGLLSDLPASSTGATL